MDKFAGDAMEVLRRQPQTVEEIGESNRRHSEFRDRMEDMWKLLDRSDRKNKVLAAWTKEQVSVARTINYDECYCSSRTMPASAVPTLCNCN